MCFRTCLCVVELSYGLEMLSMCVLNFVIDKICNVFFLLDTTGKTSYNILFMFLCCNTGITSITIYCNTSKTITITFYITCMKYWYN